MKRILLCLLCALLLTGCGKETDPAVAAAQRYQPIVQAVGDGTAVGVELTDAQIAQAVAELDAAGLTAVHVDAADPVTHPEAVAAFWAARAAGEKAALTLYEVCRDGGLLCHALLYADGADTVTRTRVVWRDGAFCVGYADTYAVTALTYDGGMLTYVYDMPTTRRARIMTDTSTRRRHSRSDKPRLRALLGARSRLLSYARRASDAAALCCSAACASSSILSNTCG